MSIVTTPKSVDISVVLPVYRNADTLRPVHRRLRDVLESHGSSFEIVFVDDASPDGSLAILKELANLDSSVRVLALARNIGQHRAVLAGLPLAGGRWVVVMDADLQDPPEAIPQLLRKAQEGFAAVFAGRRGRYESAWRLLESWLFKRLLHLACGIPADAGLFVAMNPQMVERLLALRARRPYLVAMIGCTGLPLASIPVARLPRTVGSAYSHSARLKTGLAGIGWVLTWRWRRGKHDAT